MSTLVEYKSAWASYVSSMNSATPAIEAGLQTLSNIDPAASDAQSQLDAAVAALESARSAPIDLGKTVADVGAALPDIADASAPGVVESSWKADQDKFATLVDKIRDTKESVQRSITESAPKPRPNVQPAAAALPTARQVDNALFAATPKTSNDLNKFISMVKGTGLVFGSKYAVQLPPIASFNMNNINLQCNVAGMPEISITGGDSRIYGESAEIPNGATYGMLQMSFIVTNEFDSLGYFEAWSNLVYNRLDRSVGYYRDFAFPVTVQVLDRGGNVRYTVFFMDCWPKTINSSGLSYDAQGNMTINVTLQYKYWMSSITGKLNPDVAPPWDGRPSSLQIPPGSPMSSFTGVGAAADRSSAVDIYGRNGLAASSILGPRIGSDLLSASNQAANGLSSLQNMSDGTAVGSLLSQYANQLGTSSSVMGSGIGSIASNLTTILAPAGQIARGVVGISSSLGAMDNLLSRMGIKTGLGNTVSNLNGVAGQIAVIGQLNGIPGAMSSLGSSIGSISGDIAAIQRSLVNVPGATKAMTGSLGNLSNTFTTSGNTISALGNMEYVN